MTPARASPTMTTTTTLPATTQKALPRALTIERRHAMYSTKINEEYIPKLYWLAKHKGTRMTKLVNEIIYLHLAQQNEKDLTPSK
jgi:hypothetical protein